jgi:hypothetical protein
MMVDELMVVQEGSATEYRSNNDIPIALGNGPEPRIDAKEREITS